MFFFFKQKTADEMRISDWSSDVCSSDLRLGLGDAGDHVVVDEVLDRLEGEVGVDGSGAVAQQEGHVVHLAGVAALDHQADSGAGLLADEVVDRKSTRLNSSH